MPFPLDVQRRESFNETLGKQESHPALHPRWVENIQFVSYTPIPKDTTDAAEVEEWSERNQCVVTDLKYLLQLPHDKFWCQVVFDETLHVLIDSYLRYAPRSSVELLDLPSDARNKHNKVHRLIFMTCLRMSTHKESKEAYLTPKVFGNILYENFLFDIPKILDLCTLYGDGNAALLEKMISNIFTQQPKYNEDLKMTIPTIYEVFENVKMKCGLQRSSSPQKLSKVMMTGSKPTDNMSVTELEDIIFYVHDVAITLAKFLEIYPLACTLFLEAGYITRLTGFYDIVIPELQNTLKKKQQEMISLKKFKNKILQAKNALLKHFNIIVSYCFLQPILESSSSVEELTEDYVQLITNILEERRFVADYEGKFSFHDDFDILLQTSKADETRLQYIQDAINSAFATYGKRKSPKGAKNSGGRLSPEGATGPDDMTRSQSIGQASAAQGPSHESMQSLVNDNTAKLNEPKPGGKKLEDFEMNSMISCVKDLLPELGEGFIKRCLEEFDYNIERVINSIMEDDLPLSLQQLDRQLTRVKEYREKEDGSTLSHRRNVYDDDEFDVFSRDEIDTTRIHKGKQSKTDTVCLNDWDEKDDLRTRIQQTYDLVTGLEDCEYSCGMYDDEYDDTYDVNDVGAADDDSADESRSRRPFVTPRILNTRPEVAGNEECSTDSETEEPMKKRDHFLEDPAEIRRRNAERMQSQRTARKPHAAAKNHDVTGDKSKTGAVSDNVLKNRKWKESHKSSAGNHNRKNMAARKQNKGMF